MTTVQIPFEVTRSFNVPCSIETRHMVPEMAEWTLIGPTGKHPLVIRLCHTCYLAFWPKAGVPE